MAMIVQGYDNLLAEDLRQAHSDGVRLDEHLPHYAEPAGAKAAVLLVHGFSATPWEMRPLADSLAERGFATLSVRLPGHGTSPEDLATRRWEEWLATLERGYDLLAARFARVYGAGLSTGSLLLLALARQRQLHGLVLLSPYLRMRHRLAPLVNWLRYLHPYQHRSLAGDAARHYYARRPLAGIHQINRLLRTLSHRLGEITLPVLVMNGEGDQVIDIDSGHRLFEQLGSTVKVYERLGPEAPHVLTSADNPHRQTVLEMAGAFLEEVDQRCTVESKCR
jgi:carboxylesterase